MDTEDRLETTMEEKEPSDATTRTRIRQSISIPFIWEVIPGTPKEDWKPTSPAKNPVEPPVKFIASVPFEWEEKPGKPLPCFSEQPPGSPLLLAQTKINSFPLSPRHSQGDDNNWSGVNDQDGVKKLAAPPIKFIASVPFEWEEKPGKPLPCFSQQPAGSPLLLAQQPKINSFPLSPRHSQGDDNNWSGINHQDGAKKLVAPPAKFIASVPFEWEEKPGKPLPCFSQQPADSPLSLAQAKINSFPLSPRHSQGDDNNWSDINDRDGDEIEMPESYPESSESETDDSFCSAPSLLANGLKPTIAISNAVPVQQTSLTGLNSGQLQSPASPASETGSSTSSYETGNTSLAGSSFLEWLFPLLTPQSNFLQKVGSSEKIVSHTQTKRQSDDIGCERNYSAAIRKPHTLGELIMMSRRRSYQRKAVQMRTKNLSKDFMKRNALGSCIVGSSNFVGRFHRRWTRQLQLKLM